MRCCDCLPVRKKIVRLSLCSKAASSAAESAAAVFPIPVGALAKWHPLCDKELYEFSIISDCPGRKLSWARNPGVRGSVSATNIAP